MEKVLKKKHITNQEYTTYNAYQFIKKHTFPNESHRYWILAMIETLK